MILTDVVVKAQERPAELCSEVSSGVMMGWGEASCAPLSPFITTHIFEPTHLSMSSGVY